jgi:Predicted transcriptional regulator with C-terminal CBS domains
MQYPAAITREGKYLLAEFPDCPGCQTFVADGESIEEAAQEALEGWLESNLGRDLVPPHPSKTRRGRGEVLLVQVDPLLAIRLDLRWARDEADLTQSHLARRVGMTQQQLARLEAGGNPTLGTLSRVAEGLGRRVVVTLEKQPEGKVKYNGHRRGDVRHRTSKSSGGEQPSSKGKARRR